MPNKRVLILANKAKPGVAEQVESLLPWFRQHVEVVAVLPANEPLPDGAEGVDVCVVFGGDGTILSAARVLASTGVPLLGVNMGKLGFLAEFNVEHMKKHFEEVLAGEARPIERMMLEVSITGCDEHKFRSPAANDVAICAGPPFRIIDLNVAHHDRPIAQYLGDGLVVSTPSGSTGYNMSAGGPILEPTLDAITITPVAPHTLSMRPIVVNSDETIYITATRVNAGTTVIVDGQLSSGLCGRDTVEVRRADKGAMIIPHPGQDFFRTLTRKLHWAHSPHHKTPPTRPSV